MGQAERLLPIVATWGAWVFLGMMLVSMLAILRLGRGRPLLVPARWPGRIASLLFAAVALIGALGLCAMLGPLRPMLAQVRQVYGVVNHPAQELAFQTVADDASHRLSELHGKVVVLNLWATWCGPCLHELPGMDRLARDYASRGLVVVTLSTEERDHLLAFAAKHPVATMNSYTAEPRGLDVPGRPITLIIDRGGVVRDVLIGARTYDELERSLRRWVDRLV
jgi:thiol-disulfide isomerase/thioredoxin